ncbi:hypothetical protein [Microbacterium sp. W4I20]|uniref:hypothetical protein n=1 Tax=Microbacterium sp. W4I20 TaxID=3042262 RepID=UPI002787F309|nr:hypothetical protein [Microbacterium sp. W4I20]MDQ0728942.1 hypothetical protein [Microbacterium sp. W4I20]
MTDPQLPPPSGAVPPVPTAPYGAVPPPPPGYQPAPPAAPPVYAAPAVAPPVYSAPTPAPQAAPPGAYQVPVGGYAAPAGAYAVPETTPRASGFLGLLALILALVAAVVTPIVVGVAGFEIGRRIPQGITTTNDDVLSVLSPARDQVLWAELSFWTGTLLGVAAIVMGIIAIRKKQGRGAGIGALVVAVLAPAIFFVVLLIAFSTGSAAGFVEFAS